MLSFYFQAREHHSGTDPELRAAVCLRRDDLPMRRRRIDYGEVSMPELDEELAAFRLRSNAFDVLAGQVIEDERTELIECAGQLASRGSVTITRPNGIVKATVHRRLLRSWILETESQRSDGAKSSHRVGIRSENLHGEDPHSLLYLGIAVAWLQKQPRA